MRLSDYVEAALELQGFSLDSHDRAEITRQFAHIERIAAIVLGADVSPDVDPAGEFRP